MVAVQSDNYTNSHLCPDTTGFAQVYLECSQYVASQRNQDRENPVATETIVKMASQMTPPDLNNNWEKYSLHLRSESIGDSQNL